MLRWLFGLTPVSIDQLQLETIDLVEVIIAESQHRYGVECGWWTAREAVWKRIRQEARARGFKKADWEVSLTEESWSLPPSYYRNGKAAEFPDGYWINVRFASLRWQIANFGPDGVRRPFLKELT